jgi:hypothetical protein
MSSPSTSHGASCDTQPERVTKIIMERPKFLNVIEARESEVQLGYLSDFEKKSQSNPDVSQQNLVPLDIEGAETQPAGPSLNEFPEGGREAWLVAAGTASILFCTLGYTNSFGVFQAYYMSHQLEDHNPDEISWIGSLQAFLIFASGAVGGPVFDRYGAWVSRNQLD